MNLTLIKEIVFAVWNESIEQLKKPYGVLVLIGMMLFAGFGLSFWQRSVGYDSAKKENAKELSEKETNIKSKDKTISDQQKNIQDLAFKIANFDCSDQSEKWMKIYRTMKSDEQKAVELERKRTEEFNKTLKNL